MPDEMTLDEFKTLLKADLAEKRKPITGEESSGQLNYIGAYLRSLDEGEWVYFGEL